MPSASVSRVIRAPQQDVWALLSDVTQAKRWNKYWSTIEFTSGQTHGAGVVFRAITDGGDSFVFEICDWDAPQRIAFCPIRGPGELYSITLERHIFQVQAVSAEESEVTITAQASASGLRGRVIAMFFWAGHQRDGLNAALDALQAVFQPELFADDGTEEQHTPEPLTD